MILNLEKDVKQNYSSVMKSLLLLLFVCCLAGCSADVKGKPALKADPETTDDGKGGKKGPGGPSFSGMGMDPDKMMLSKFDKNKDEKISPDEFPDGGLEGYDYDGDGTITLEELKKRNKEISKGGLKSMESNPDEGKEVKK